MPTKQPPISGKLPRFMHGADYNPDQWLHDPAVLEDDVRLMKLAGCNVMSVGIFSWSALEPEEGKFTFEWLDGVLGRFAENGIYAWLATPSGARPAWMSAKYPEVLRVNAGRVRNLHGSRHNHCLTSPVYREKVRLMNGMLASRYADHPAVVGWHVSNELNGACHCALCQEAFRDWLKKKYRTLDALNRAWWTSFWSHTYTDFEQIESPAPHGENKVHGMNLDWKRFVTDQTIDYCLEEMAPLRSVSPELPVTTNMMDWVGFDGLDYRKLAAILDVVSWDAYPTWHDAEEDSRAAVRFSFSNDLFRSLKGKPFLLMESTPSLTNWQPVSKLKRPGMHRLSSLQAVAHGSDSVQYFQWRKSRGSSEKFHGAVVDHAGHEHTRVFREVAELGRTLAGLTEVLGCGVPAQTAIIVDWDNRWAVNDAQGPRNKGLRYEETVLQHYKALWEQGVPVDIIGSSDNFSKYKLVIAPMLYMTTKETGERVESFVTGGGTFVATYWSGIVDEHDLCHLGGFPGPLRRTLGIWSEELEGLHGHEMNAIQLSDGNELGLSGVYGLHDLCDLIHTEGAVALAAYTDDFYAGRPVLTVNRIGKGEAYYLATRAKEPFYNDFYRSLINRTGIARVLDTALPSGVTAQMRSDGRHDYIFVMNFSGKEQTVQLDSREYVDLETGEPIAAGTLFLPVYGIRMLRRASRTQSDEEGSSE